MSAVWSRRGSKSGTGLGRKRNSRAVARADQVPRKQMCWKNFKWIQAHIPQTVVMIVHSGKGSKMLGRILTLKMSLVAEWFL